MSRQQAIWNDKQLSRLKQFYRLGRSIERIAQELGRTRCSVENKLFELRRGGKLRVRPSLQRKWDKAEIAEILALRDQGLSSAQIAMKLKVTKNMILGVWKRHSDSYEPVKPPVYNKEWTTSYLGQDVDELTLQRESRRLGPLPRLDTAVRWGVAEYGGR